MPGITIDNIYETTEAAKLIGISYATLYRRIKAGKITPIRIAGRTLIPKSEIERLIAGRTLIPKSEIERLIAGRTLIPKSEVERVKKEKAAEA